MNRRESTRLLSGMTTVILVVVILSGGVSEWRSSDHSWAFNQHMEVGAEWALPDFSLGSEQSGHPTSLVSLLSPHTSLVVPCCQEEQHGETFSCCSAGIAGLTVSANLLFVYANYLLFYPEPESGVTRETSPLLHPPRVPA